MLSQAYLYKAQYNYIKKKTFLYKHSYKESY